MAGAGKKKRKGRELENHVENEEKTEEEEVEEEGD